MDDLDGVPFTGMFSTARSMMPVEIGGAPSGEKIPTAMMPALREFRGQWSERSRAGAAIAHLLGEPSVTWAGDRYRHGG
jgi:hypothetical protein